MQRGSDKHGPRQDDALRDETLGLTAGGGGGGAPEGMTPKDLDDRAALAALLGKEIWPADTETVQRRVRESLGADRLRDLVARLRKGRVYQGASEVWADITNEPAERRF